MERRASRIELEKTVDPSLRVDDVPAYVTQMDYEPSAALLWTGDDEGRLVCWSLRELIQASELSLVVGAAIGPGGEMGAMSQETIAERRRRRRLSLHVPVEDLRAATRTPGAATRAALGGARIEPNAIATLMPSPASRGGDAESAMDAAIRVAREAA
jgi:hypothetical protein